MMDGVLTEGLCRRQFQSFSDLKKGKEKEKWAGPPAERRSAPDFREEQKKEEELSGGSIKKFNHEKTAARGRHGAASI